MKNNRKMAGWSDLVRDRFGMGMVCALILVGSLAPLQAQTRNTSKNGNTQRATTTNVQNSSTTNVQSGTATNGAANTQTADVLFLRNGVQIIGTITDMTETTVSYTRADRPKTLVFSTPMEQIEKIIFSDGTMAQIADAQTTTTQYAQTTTQYTQAAQATAAPQNTQVTQAVAQTAVQPAVQATAQTAVQPAVQTTVQTTAQTTAQTTQTTTQPTKSAVAGKGRIYRDKFEYMYDDKYISEKEVERVIRTNYAAYEEWQSAKRMITAGWVMVGLSSAGLIATLGCIPAGGAAVGGAAAGTVVFASVGAGLAIGSLKRMDKAITIYNAQIDMATELHLFAAPEGIGVAVRF